MIRTDGRPTIAWAPFRKRIPPLRVTRDDETTTIVSTPEVTTVAEFIFVPNYTVEADTDDEAFAIALNAIERDIAHYRRHGTTQIEWVTLDEILARQEGDDA